jgi:uncharacterized protein YqgC (DUF456 family)
MEIFVYISATLLAIIWLLGSILPVLPGIIFSAVGILLVQFATSHVYSIQAWIIMAILVAIALLGDYFLPIRWAKHSGWGSKRGTRWSLLGMIVGLFVPPRGLIVGPLLGAFVGAYIHHREKNIALKAARGSFVWSSASTILKLIAAGMMLYYILAAWL